jgi:hypothetical protein
MSYLFLSSAIRSSERDAQLLKGHAARLLRTPQAKVTLPSVAKFSVAEALEDFARFNCRASDAFKKHYGEAVETSVQAICLHAFTTGSRIRGLPQLLQRPALRGGESLLEKVPRVSFAHIFSLMEQQKQGGQGFLEGFGAATTFCVAGTNPESPDQVPKAGVYFESDHWIIHGPIRIFDPITSGDRYDMDHQRTEIH